MPEYVALNRNTTIIVPDSYTVEMIIKTYRYYGGINDFIEPRNRYVWLYRSMDKCVIEIENE